jgi:hypothetical protein
MGWLFRFTIYWLNIFISKSALTVTALVFGGSVLSGIWLIYERIKNKKVTTGSINLLLQFLVAFFIMILASVPSIFGSADHIDSIRVEDKVYHLAGTSTFIDYHYYLTECEPLGMICWVVHGEETYSTSDMLGKTSLVYEQNKGELQVISANKGLIFTYQP